MPRADVKVNPTPEPDVPLLRMSLPQFQRMRTGARIRMFLTRPILTLRMAMLKLALLTGSLEGVTIEAQPVLWHGVTPPDQYVACIRVRNHRARLVAEVAVGADKQNHPAWIIHIRKIHLPYYTVKMRWPAGEKQKEEQP